MSTETIEEREATALLEHYGDFSKCYDFVTKAFGVITQRTQMLLTLATLTLTITGFSGPKIAASNLLSRYTMIFGLVFVLCSILVSLVGVLRIRWTSEFLNLGPKPALIAVLKYRNGKTKYYIMGCILLVLGLTSYVTSVISYLATGL